MNRFIYEYGVFIFSYMSTSIHTQVYAASFVQDHAVLLLLLNPVGFSICARSIRSGGNILYQLDTSSERANRQGWPLNIFTWFIGSGGLHSDVHGELLIERTLRARAHTHMCLRTHMCIHTWTTAPFFSKNRCTCSMLFIWEPPKKKTPRGGGGGFFRSNYRNGNISPPQWQHAHVAQYRSLLENRPKMQVSLGK